MNSSVVFCLDGTKWNAVGVSFARRPVVEKLTVARLRRGYYVHLCSADGLAMNLGFDLQVTESQRDARHWERFAAKSAEQAIQLLVITRNTKLMLRHTVPAFQLLVIEIPRPIPSDVKLGLQAKITRNKSRRVATPSPRAPANHAVVARLKRIVCLSSNSRWI